MKKKIVPISLFVIPIVTYMFFASGVYNFGKLSIITKGIYFSTEMRTIDNKMVSAKGEITILGFLGDDARLVRISVFNLN